MFSPNKDTIWLSKEDMSILFDGDRSLISRYIKKIFEEKIHKKVTSIFYAFHIPISQFHFKVFCTIYLKEMKMYHLW